ncbi:MAG: Na+/H+ antiporter subunit E [bacterium]|nr:Na+/H+ antiporter subunit E [bacterium]
MKRIFLVNSVVQFVLLMAVWLLLSGHYDPTHITMGVISVSIVVWLHIPLRKYYAFEEEIGETEDRLKGLQPVRIRYSRLLFYIPWLIWQIVIASLQVAVVVLNPKPLKYIDPALLKFKTKLPNPSAQVILGNSITLTPGTITVQIKDEEFLVHALMDKSYGGIEDSSLPDEVGKLYDKKTKQVVGKIEFIKSRAEMSK